MTRRALVWAASAALLAGAAAAEPGCEASDEVCVMATPQACQKIAFERCKAEIETAAAIGGDGEIGGGILVGEIEGVIWLAADDSRADLAERRVGRDNEALTRALAALVGRHVYLDLRIDAAGSPWRETGYDPEIEDGCVGSPAVLDITYAWDNEIGGQIFLPTRYLTEGACKGLPFAGGGGFSLPGDEGPFENEIHGCGTECALRTVVGLFEVSLLAGTGVDGAPWADGKSRMRPAVVLISAEGDRALRDRLAQAAESALEQ